MITTFSRISSVCCAFVLTLALTGCSEMGKVPTTRQSMESMAKMDSFPAPARLAAERVVDGGVVREVMTSEFEGRTVYDVNFTSAKGFPGEVQVTSDGQELYKNVVEEMAVPFEQVPGRVKAALMARTGNIKPTTTSKRMYGDREVYVFGVTIAGFEQELIIDELGTMIRQEGVIAASQLPMVVQSAVMQRFGGLEIKRASEIREGAALYYGVEGEMPKRMVKAVLLPNGTVRSVKVK